MRGGLTAPIRKKGKGRRTGWSALCGDGTSFCSRYLNSIRGSASRRHVHMEKPCIPPGSNPMEDCRPDRRTSGCHDYWMIEINDNRVMHQKGLPKGYSEVVAYQEDRFGGWHSRCFVDCFSNLPSAL